ncbi:MAG: hypothetical protein HQ557_07885 [Bacteroidetes bacterium]|nr:hypothetical protein [Bacteroidota bacterium]
MKYLIFILLIPLFLTSCLQQDITKNNPSTTKQVFLDWEQIDDPKIPIQLLNIPPIDLPSISDSNKSHFIFRYIIENLDMFDTYIYLEIYTSVFDSDGNHIISFDNTNRFGFLNGSEKSTTSVGGGSSHEVSFAKAEAYSSSITFIRQFKNKNGEILFFDRNIIKQYLENNYPNVDIVSYFDLLNQTPDLEQYLDFMNSDNKK